MRPLSLSDLVVSQAAAGPMAAQLLDASHPGAAVSASLVGRLITSLGQPDFDEQFVTVCRALSNVEQLTAFAVEDGRPRSILAFRARGARLVETLCQSYVARHHANDIFLNTALAEDGCYTTDEVLWNAVGNPAYQRLFFTGAGLESKFAILARYGERHIYLNIYFRQRCSRDSVRRLEDYGKLLVEALGAHDELTGGPYRAASGKLRIEALLRQRFPILSPREVQVCARIVSGYSVEGTAIDLAVSSTTVTTFRRRAYAKLGISSQSELFASCAGVNVQVHGVARN